VAWHRTTGVVLRLENVSIGTAATSADLWGILVVVKLHAKSWWGNFCLRFPSLEVRLLVTAPTFFQPPSLIPTSTVITPSRRGMVSHVI
jgi:hypothetical protein